jgi:Na+-driven multidrug efflux pump
MPDSIVSLFGQPTNIPNPADYWVFAEKTFRIFLALVTFTCIIKMSSIFFQAVGKPLYAIVASMIRDIVCFIPLIIILPRFFGIEVILFAAPCADLIAMIVTIFLTRKFMNTLKTERTIEEASEPEIA